MKTGEDAYGTQLLTQYETKARTAELIERDDDFIDLGSDAGLYFTEYKDWPESERQAVDEAKGRVLDVGCGAGRHSLYLQSKGLDVTSIDNSPGAISVCKSRGLEKAMVCPISSVGTFEPNSFDTILMLGNNFGLFASPENAKTTLSKFARITSSDARIIAGTRDPYRTDNDDHLQYHKLNEQRGRMAGQIRMRIRYGKIVGEWFDYLFVSPAEMQDILGETDWRINRLITREDANYFAVIVKK